MPVDTHGISEQEGGLDEELLVVELGVRADI